MHSAMGDVGTWPRWDTTEDAGWSADALDTAREFSAGIGSAPFMLAVGGRVVTAWGDIASRLRVHFVLIIPALDAVIVHRVDTDIPDHAVSSGRIGRLFRLVLAARI